MPSDREQLKVSVKTESHLTTFDLVPWSGNRGKKGDNGRQREREVGGPWENTSDLRPCFRLETRSLLRKNTILYTSDTHDVYALDRNVWELWGMTRAKTLVRLFRIQPKRLKWHLSP